MRKCIINVYKPNGFWEAPPPGIGDFIKGTLTLKEIGLTKGFDVKVHLCDSTFAQYLKDGPEHYKGAFESIPRVYEYVKIKQHKECLDRISKFLNSSERTLFLSTNLGTWNTTKLEESTKDFGRIFYRFKEPIEAQSRTLSGGDSYSVISVRTGDAQLGTVRQISWRKRRLVLSLVRGQILKKIRGRVLVVGDCYALNRLLRDKFGFIHAGEVSQHSGKSRYDQFSTMVDLCLLSRSTYNFHINTEYFWWSGFCHWTSLINRVGATYFVPPLYSEEIVSENGEYIRKWNAEARLRQFKGRLQDVLK